MVKRGTKLSDGQQHYVEKDDYNLFIYHQKSTSVTERVLTVMHDAASQPMVDFPQKQLNRAIIVTIYPA